MIESLHRFANIAMAILVAPAAVVGVFRIFLTRYRFERALGYCRRDKDGNLYVIDPQSGELRRLKIRAGRFYVDRKRFTKAEKKQIKRLTTKIRRDVADMIMRAAEAAR